MGFLGDVLAWFTEADHWRGDNGVTHRLYEHIVMSAACIGGAAAFSLPIGVLMGHLGRGGFVAINVSNVGRALPSFAILVLAFQLLGLGPEPAVVALVALAIPPMVTNSYVGVRGVDPEIREAARGMGMTGRQVLARVELPMALPLIFAGVRTAAVQVVATATLAAVIAWGGLGRYIVDGLSQRDNVQVFAGAVLVAVLSIVTELSLALVQRRVVSKGLTGADPVAGAGLPDAVAAGVVEGA
jgi:osmoprotectant transport system permease protein